jgi:nucleotide-binding universal stress UspA family protein
MSVADAPILIAYDGSEPARRAIREAAALLGPRSALVATIWEPGLAYSSAAIPSSGLDLQPGPIDVAEARELEEELQAQARRTAAEGAELAGSAGLSAEALTVPDRVNVADAIIDLARERGAAAIVIGSRGLTGLRARLEGSTSSVVVKHATCPVLVVHDD